MIMTIVANTIVVAEKETKVKREMEQEKSLRMF